MTEEKIKKSNSKRNISKLEIDFREKICDFALEHNYKCANALLILKMSGCRPDELEKGVTVNYNPANNFISLKILGSKLNRKQKRGIAIREIKLKINDENIKYIKPIIDIFEKNPDAYDLKISIESKKAFSGYITKISKKLWPRKKYHASAYSFRHAKATELKNSDKTKIEIAQILGHASTRSMESYGRKSKSKAGGFDDIEDVKTSSKPRQNDRLLRFKIASKNKATSNVANVSTSPTAMTTPPKMKR